MLSVSVSGIHQLLHTCSSACCRSGKIRCNLTRTFATFAGLTSTRAAFNSRSFSEILCHVNGVVHTPELRTQTSNSIGHATTAHATRVAHHFAQLLNYALSANTPRMGNATIAIKSLTTRRTRSTRPRRTKSRRERTTAHSRTRSGRIRAAGSLLLLPKKGRNPPLAAARSLPFLYFGNPFLGRHVVLLFCVRSE